METLPPEVVSNILTWFCDGKSISTFACVVLGSTTTTSRRRRRQDASSSSSGWTMEVIQKALSQRYKYLARNHFQNNEEISDVLEVLGEQIRVDASIHCENPGDLTTLSGYCAILDYFEQQREIDNYLIWVGPITTQFGILQVELRSKEWTPTSLQHWYNDFELYQFSLASPLRTPTLSGGGLPYGSLTSSLNTWKIWKIVLYNLNSELEELGRYSLVPRHLDFEANPSILFTKRYQESKFLKCYWDQEDEYDWEYGIEKLGQNVIRIMKRMGPSFPSVEDKSEVFAGAEGEDDDSSTFSSSEDEATS